MKAAVENKNVETMTDAEVEEIKTATESLKNAFYKISEELYKQAQAAGGQENGGADNSDPDVYKRQNEGDSVIVVVNNGTATFITAYSSGTSSNIKEGTITSISKTRITIENGSKKATYKFDDDYNDVTLKLDGKTSKDIDDLIELVKDGENIEAEITADKNGYVTKITAETVEKKALEGLSLIHI